MNDTQLDFLLQTDIKEYIKSLGKESWITVYKLISTESENRAFFCALIPNEGVADALNDASWNFSIGEGLPGCSIVSKDGKNSVEYHRFGSVSGVEPFILVRDFFGIKPSHIEILEEFRLFHNLYYDAESNVYIKIYDDGNQEEIVKIGSNSVQVKLREIRQFLAVKEMHLAIFFEVVRYSTIPFSEIDPSFAEIQVRDEKYCYGFFVVDEDNFLFKRNHKSFSRLLGKKLIPGVDKEKSGIWPYNKEVKEFVDFIIDIDDDGDDKIHNCNPDLLANYFGANPGSPHYLTPVFFRREVLNKYYANPEKYSVEDGYLRCGGLWGIRIDNNHEKYVGAFLGDIGRDLFYEEQLYWRSFNVPPEGEISNVSFIRSFRGDFADPEKADLLFKYRFESFQDEWQTKFGWALFKPLSAGDAHFYTSLRLPLTDDQAEFDGQVLALTKIIIDSLNEKELAKDISGLAPNTRGITKFEKFLELHGFEDYDQIIGFLRDLQSLRSSGVGHRKGKKYERVAAIFRIGQKGLILVFKDILVQATALIDALQAYFL